MDVLVRISFGTPLTLTDVPDDGVFNRLAELTNGLSYSEQAERLRSINDGSRCIGQLDALVRAVSHGRSVLSVEKL